MPRSIESQVILSQYRFVARDVPNFRAKRRRSLANSVFSSVSNPIIIYIDAHRIGYAVEREAIIGYPYTITPEKPGRDVSFCKRREITAVVIITLYIDTNACPVKQEIYRVVERHVGKGAFLVATGLDPVAHAERPAWIAGSGPAMTKWVGNGCLPGMLRQGGATRPHHQRR